MAIIGPRLEQWPLPIGLYRPMNYEGPYDERPESWIAAGYEKIVRRRKKQVDRNTINQRWFRMVNIFLGRAWSLFSQEEKDTWLHWPCPTRFQPGGGFFPLNTKRWMEMKGPSRLQTPSDDPTTAEATILDACRVDGEAKIFVSSNSTEDIWGVVIISSPETIIFPSFQQASVFQAIEPSEMWECLDKRPFPGSCHYRVAAFTEAGQLGTWSPDIVL